MIKKTSTQISLGFSSLLEERLNPKHPIFRLSKEIQWQVFDQEFSKHYSAKNGKPSKPIRLMVSLLILKQLRKISRKLTADRFGKYAEKLSIYEKVLAQKRGDSHKIYSIHELQVKCFTKGKEHKKYEFGSKVSILVTQTTGVIVGAMNFNSTEHDSKTIAKAIAQYERLTGKIAQNAYVDRGYRGINKVNQTNILVPKPDKNISPQKRKGHSRRAAIEPVIGHLKDNYRMRRNFLKGVIGDEINVLMSAAAMNFKRVMNLWLTEAIYRWKLIWTCIQNVSQMAVA